MANPNTFSKFRTTFNPKVSVIQETRKASSVPEATVTSQSEKIQAFRDRWDKVKENIFNSISQSNPVPDSPPIQNVVSESSQEVSDDIWSQTTQLLERVKASGSITITKVSTGSQIEKSQSPVLAEASEKVTSPIKTTSVQANPPNLTSSVSAESAPLELSQDREEGWPNILDRYKEVLNSD